MYHQVEARIFRQPLVLVRAWTEEKRGARVLWIMLATEPVVVRDQPEMILIDRQAFHDPHERKQTMISVFVGRFHRAKIILGLDAVRSRVHPQDDVVFAHQDIKFSAKPAEVRVMRPPK